jgi:hypothetical protein
MTDLNKVIAGAKSIEHILVEQFGGTGRGMKEKLDSVRYPIPLPLQKRISHLAYLRNRAVHEEGFDLHDSEDYQRKCEAVCQELQQLHAIVHRVAQQRASAQRTGQQPARRARDLRALKVGGVVLALIVGWAALHPKAPTVPQVASAPAAAPAVVPAVARKGTAAPADSGKRTPPAVVPGEAHIGIGNDVLAIEAIEFGFRKGGFDAQEPRMTVTVRNSSDRTIASARLDGRLYIGGEAGPVVDTGSGSSFSSKPLYLFFRDEGLAPGARQSVDVSLSGDDRWRLPDVMNASRRTLVLRVNEVTDGRKRAFGEGASAWPAVPSGASAAVLRPASPTTDEHDYRQRFFAGEHVVLSDSHVTIDDLELRLRDDGFGSRKPVIRARFTNRSGVTLSSATFRVQLFIKGEKTPAVDSKEGFGAENIYAFFPERGLADGASVKQDFSASSRGNWDAPDVLNAIRNGNAQLVVRLESLSDGRNQAVPSAAIPVSTL